MQLVIITIDAVCTDVLQGMGVIDDPQATMTTAEVMTTALVVARFFGGCIERSRQFLHEEHSMLQMLSKSCFNRRLHAIPEALWGAVLAAVTTAHHLRNDQWDYIIDSFPVAVCDNIATGAPVEVVLVPTSYSDERMGKTLHLDLPARAMLYADAAYTGYVWEDALLIYG